MALTRTRRAPPEPPEPIAQKSWNDARAPIARLLRWTIASAIGLPAKHAETHKGGDDSVMSTGVPLSVTLTGSADAGTPTDGAAAGDHVHALELGLAKGDILTSDGVTPQGQAVGPDGTTPIADATQPTGWRWGTVNPFSVPLGSPADNYNDFLLRMSIEGYQNRPLNAATYR